MCVKFELYNNESDVTYSLRLEQQVINVMSNLLVSDLHTGRQRRFDI